MLRLPAAHSLCQMGTWGLSLALLGTSRLQSTETKLANATPSFREAGIMLVPLACMQGRAERAPRLEAGMFVSSAHH